MVLGKTAEKTYFISRKIRKIPDIVPLFVDTIGVFPRATAGYRRDSRRSMGHPFFCFRGGSCRRSAVCSLEVGIPLRNFQTPCSSWSANPIGCQLASHAHRIPVKTILVKPALFERRIAQRNSSLLRRSPFPPRTTRPIPYFGTMKSPMAYRW